MEQLSDHGSQAIKESDPKTEETNKVSTALIQLEIRRKFPGCCQESDLWRRWTVSLRREARSGSQKRPVSLELTRQASEEVLQ